MSYDVLVFIIALLVSEDQILVGKADKCEDSYELFRESCYQLSNTTATREEAAAACRPGHLVDISSEEEQDFIVDLLTDAQVGDAWFGLLKSLSWSDGSSLVHEPWQNIRANEGDRCFRLDGTRQFIWNELECNYFVKSICEYELSDNKNCRTGFTHFNRSCYHINHDELKRSEAAAACGTMHLADITSNEEHQYVVELMTASGVYNAWFGLTLSDPPSWSDGSILTSESWYDIIRTNGNSVCYRLKYQSSGRYRWDDAPSSSCRDPYRYICEYEVAVAVSSTSESPTSLKTGNTGAIVGSLLGVAVLIASIGSITWFFLRHKKGNHPEAQSQDKVPSFSAGTTRQPRHSNPTHAIYTEAATEDAHYQNNIVHHIVHASPPGKVDEHIYTSAETAAVRHSSHTSHTSNKDSPSESWKDNTIDVTSNDMASAQNAEEGWADNSVYAK